jgi:catechol 2,3-dioxygenase-like lactoylglutathione lyase family enzyme
LIKNIALIGLVVEDLEKAKSFYTKLGFNIDLELDLPAIQIRNAFVSLAGTKLELIEAYPGVKLPYHRDGVINHMTFEVDDIEASMRELKDLGVEFITELQAVTAEPVGLVKFVHGKGVNGEIIELWELPAQ